MADVTELLLVVADLGGEGFDAGAFSRHLLAAASTLGPVADPPGAAVTSPQARHPAVLGPPPCTPAAIRAVLAANADAAVLESYDHELDAAFERAREDSDLTPLLQTVRRWWFEADAWRDPVGRRQFQQRVDRYLSEGPPPPEERMSRGEIRARYGV